MDDPAAPAPPPTLCIDATRGAAGWRLWGMSLAERLLREGSRRGLRRAVICVTPETAAPVARFRPDLDRLHPQQRRLVEVAGSPEARRWLADHVEGPVLFLEGDAVVDDRVLDHLLAAGPGCLVRGEGAGAAHLPSAALLAQPAGGGPWDPDPGAPLRVVEAGDLGPYVPELRLTMAPFLIRLADPRQLRPIDRLMFHRTFKGVIDVVARYGYYHLVRFLTRGLSRDHGPAEPADPALGPRRLGRRPLLRRRAPWGRDPVRLGRRPPRLGGRQARPPHRQPERGRMGALEHAAAIPGLGLWFAALGWHLGEGRLLTPVAGRRRLLDAGGRLPPRQALHRRLQGALRIRVVRPPGPSTPPFTSFAARRNVHLLILTIGAGLGAAAAAFQGMAWAMAATLVVHALRFAWIAATGAREPAPGG